jgi:hypothetical protein
VGRGTGLLAAVLVSALSVACDLVEPPPTPSPTPLDSGIRGSVLLTSDCPGHAPATCFEPYAARLVILDADGGVVGEARSDPAGRFEVLLPPGEYTIAPVPGGDPFPVSPLQAVSVVEGELTVVEVRYDPGRAGRP